MFEIADERLNGWHKGARHQQKVKSENSDQIQQRVESRSDFPGFDGGNVDLRESYSACEFALAPVVGMPCSDKGMPEIFRQTFKTCSDMRRHVRSAIEYIFTHHKYSRQYALTC